MPDGAKIDSNIARLAEYIDGVSSGRIAAGKWVRLAVDRHIKDLERQGTDEFPYFFDEAEAEEVAAFFPLCFRHSKGRWAGEPFHLEGWQLFCVCSIFGWRRPVTEEEKEAGMKRDCVRRFRRAFISVARKNGKTALACGIILFMAVGDGEAIAETYTAATKIEQAKLCLFSEAQRMIARSGFLKDRAKTLHNSIRFKNESYLQPIGSDKSYDGLNPHCVVLDEIHAWREQHRRFHETMKTGSGSRDQYLLLSITTAGDDQSKIWKEEAEYVRGVVEGRFSDESMFAYLAEIDEDDDPFDKSVWGKANPNLGVSVSEEYIDELAREAQAIGSKRNQFLRYHCNTMVSSQERAFEPEAWDACAGKLSDWKTADAICGGFDIGTRDDLAAYAFCARFPLPEKDTFRYEFFAKAFMSDQTVRDLTVPPWPEFLRLGLIQKHRYVVSALRDELLAECERHGATFVAYDPAGATLLAEDLEAAGITGVRMPQTYIHYSEPIQELLAAIRDGRVTHNAGQDGDILLRWAAANAVIVRDRGERWMYDKSSSADKIDPIVAVTMALKCVMAAPARSSGSLFIHQ